MLRPPTRALPSVVVDTEKVLREADGPMKRPVPRPAMRDGWKGVRSGVRIKSGTVRAGEEPEEHKRKRSIEQEIRNKNLAPETEIMKETPWSRIREQNSTKNSWRLLAMGVQRAVF